MESIRNFLKSWPGRIFLMICLSPLVILGLESYFSGGSNANEVAKVGDQSISRTEYQNAINARRNELLQSGIQSSAINTAVLNKNVLDGLINRAILKNEVQRLGMHVSDEDIQEMLIKDPQYLDDKGNFSNDRFAFALKQQGLTKDQLFEQYRQQLNIMQLYSSITSTALYPQADVLKLISREKETREVSLHRIPWQNYQDEVSVSNKEIEDYYNENKASLNSVAMVDLSYVKLDPKSVSVEEPTEEEIEAQYDAFRASYTGDYSQKVSQILITGADAQKRIKQIATQIKQGEDFATLAKEVSEDPISSAKGGDIGSFNPDAFGEDSVKVAKAIQGLNKGEVSEPIKTSFGYQIFKVTDVEGEGIPSLESKRDELIAEVERQKRENYIGDQITKINDMATDGVGINDIAQDAGLEVHTIKNYKKVDNTSELNQPAVIAAAFDDFAIQDESVSPSVKVNDSTIWVQPTNYRPVAPLSLEQASEQIRQKLVKDKSIQMALNDAKAIAKQVNDKGVNAVKVDLESLGTINRQHPALTASEKALAFNESISTDDRISTATETEAGATVMVLGKLNTVDPDSISAEERMNTARLVKQGRGQEQFADYLEYLKTATEVKMNDSVINDVAGL